MPESQLDDLALIVIQPGEGGADSPRQFGSLGVAAANGRRASDIGRMLLPVRFHPESESGTAYPEFGGYRSDRPTQINHHLGGFILKFRRIPFRIPAPRHLIPVLSAVDSIGSRSGKDGISQSQCAPAGEGPSGPGVFRTYPVSPNATPSISRKWDIQGTCRSPDQNLGAEFWRPVCCGHGRSLAYLLSWTRIPCLTYLETARNEAPAGSWKL